MAKLKSDFKITTYTNFLITDLISEKANCIVLLYGDFKGVSNLTSDPSDWSKIDKAKLAACKYQASDTASDVYQFITSPLYSGDYINTLTKDETKNVLDKLTYVFIVKIEGNVEEDINSIPLEEFYDKLISDEPNGIGDVTRWTLISYGATSNSIQLNKLDKLIINLQLNESDEFNTTIITDIQIKLSTSPSSIPGHIETVQYTGKDPRDSKNTFRYSFDDHGYANHDWLSDKVSPYSETFRGLNVEHNLGFISVNSQANLTQDENKLVLMGKYNSAIHSVDAIVDPNEELVYDVTSDKYISLVNFNIDIVEISQITGINKDTVKNCMLNYSDLGFDPLYGNYIYTYIINEDGLGYIIIHKESNHSHMSNLIYEFEPIEDSEDTEQLSDDYVDFNGYKSTIHPNYTRLFVPNYESLTDELLKEFNKNYKVIIPRIITYGYTLFIPYKNSMKLITIDPDKYTDSISTTSPDAMEKLLEDTNRMQGDYNVYEYFLIPDFLDMGFVAINNTNYLKSVEIDDNSVSTYTLDLDYITKNEFRGRNKDFWNNTWNYIALGQTCSDDNDSSKSEIATSDKVSELSDQYYLPICDYIDNNIVRSTNYGSGNNNNSVSLLELNYKLAKLTYNGVIHYHKLRFLDEGYNNITDMKITDSGIIVTVKYTKNNLNYTVIEFYPYSITRFDYKLAKSITASDINRVQYNNSTVLVQSISNDTRTYKIVGTDKTFNLDINSTILMYRGVNIKLSIDNNYNVTLGMLEVD